MFCENCGNQIGPNEKFCTNCGHPTGNNIINDVGQSVDKSFNSAMGDVTQTLNNGDYVPGTPLKCDRGLVGFILLNLITCGIYSWFFIHAVARDMNIALEGDNERTPGLGSYILFSILTCGIYSWYWEYKLGNRMQLTGSTKYKLPIVENGTSILLWNIFGSLLCFIGPYIAMNIIIKNSNMIARAYNNTLTSNK